MQKEIEMLLMALHQEQNREKKLLDSILEAIAAGGAARKRMTDQIAEALAEANQTEVEDIARRESLANDIEDAIVSLRKLAA